MRQKLSILLMVVLLLSSLTLPSAYAAEPSITVYIDNAPVSFDVAPVVENGRTLVPMRAIFEAFNTTVTWNNDTQTATASTEYLMCLELQIGNPVALKYFLSPSDDYDYATNTGTFTKDQMQEIKLDVPAKVVGGRTMVPLRFIAESMNYDVKWDGAHNRVDIITGTSPAQPLSEETQYKQSCAYTGFEYNDAVVNSSRHAGERRAFTGSINAIMGNSILLDSGNIVKVYMPDETLGQLYVNDRCTVYGELNGTATYDTKDQFGFPITVTVPYMVAKYADGSWNQAEFEASKDEYDSEIIGMFGTWKTTLTLNGSYTYDPDLVITNTTIDGVPYTVSLAEKRNDGWGVRSEYLYMELCLKYSEEDYPSGNYEYTNGEVWLTAKYYYLTDLLETSNLAAWYPSEKMVRCFKR